MSRLTLVILVAFSLAPSGLRGAGFPVSAEVAAVLPGRAADLVLLTRGFDAGLREGMVCRISRGTAEVAEVILVELRPNCASALILGLSPRHSIRPGDSASVKILKS